MSLRIACISCGDTYSARTHAGLVRCSPCEERLAPRMPSAGATVVTFDTPGEAWA